MQACTCSCLLFFPEAHPPFEHVNRTAFPTLRNRPLVSYRSRHPATTPRRGVINCRRPWSNLSWGGEAMEVATVPSSSRSSGWSSNQAAGLLTARLRQEKAEKVDRYPAEIASQGTCRRVPVEGFELLVVGAKVPCSWALLRSGMAARKCHIRFGQDTFMPSSLQPSEGNGSVPPRFCLSRFLYYTCCCHLRAGNQPLNNAGVNIIKAFHLMKVSCPCISSTTTTPTDRHCSCLFWLAESCGRRKAAGAECP